MPNYTALSEPERETFDGLLAQRPFTDSERQYWKQCWLPVSQAQVDAINALMPPNHFVAPRTKDGQLYINVDVLSDAFPDSPTRRLSAVFDAVKDIEWEYIQPWEWGNEEPSAAWVAYDGTPDTIYQVGDGVSHDSKEWVSTVPDNVWEPGVFGWKEPTADGIPPLWRQPLGAGGAYNTGDHVQHNSQLWECSIDDNVWAPGGTGWTELNPTPPENNWAAGVAYAVDDEVDYQGTMYRCLQPHTSQVGWEPPNVPALWQAIV